jgi:hypothetical protein
MLVAYIPRKPPEMPTPTPARLSRELELQLLEGLETLT